MQTPLTDMRQSIADAVQWLDSALGWVTMSGYGDMPSGTWPELDAYLARLAEVLTLARTLLPMPASLEAAADRECQDFQNADRS